MIIKNTIGVVFLFSVCSLGFGQCLTDDFNTGYGDWEATGTYQNYGAANAVGFNDKDDAITTLTTVTNPQAIIFNLSRTSSTANRTISLQYATSTTGPWTTARDILVSEVTESYQNFSVVLNLTGDYFLRFIITQRTGGTYFLDDVAVSCGANNGPDLQLISSENTYQSCGYTIDFGAVSTESSVQTSFIIKNTGSDILDISEIITPDEVPIISPSLPLSISVNEEVIFLLEFAPEASGAFTESLVIKNSDPDEANCSINLEGTAYEPLPEIDVERNTEASIPSGALANSGYNTIFAGTQVGATSNTKLYYLANEGSSDLFIESIISSNPSEFNVISNSGSYTIPPGTKISFEIVFSPINTGTRTSLISISNSDLDENPYNFTVQGTGICPSPNMTINPESGPKGTTVSVTGSNFSSASKASLNHVEIPISVNSTTALKLEIPENASSGNLAITNDLGCTFTTNFTIISNTSSGCESTSEDYFSDLFLSEVTDHPTGSHSYVEIYNGTGTPVDLSGYSIRIHNNGNTTATHNIALNGNVNNHEVFVLAFGSDDATTDYASHGYDQVSTVTGINSNDHIRLYNNDNWIDLWGDTSGDDFTIASRGYTYQRNYNTETTPNTTWNAEDWTAYASVNYTDIGQYKYSTGSPPKITIQPSVSNAGCKLNLDLSVQAAEGYSGGNTLNYQWFYLAPEADNWQTLEEGTTFTGTKSATLKIESTLNLNEYQFYCLIQEPDKACSSISNAVTLTNNISKWNGSKWLNSDPPNPRSITVLNGNYNALTHGNFNTCSLYIPINNTLTIGENSYIKVMEDLIAAGDILVKNKGSFVQEDDAAKLSVSGTIIVEKETAILNTWYEYTYWSSPVKNDTFESVFENSKRLYWYNAANFTDIYREQNNDNSQILGQDDVDDNNDDWQAIKDSEVITKSDVLEAGVGYAATHTPANFTEGQTYSYKFSGPFNNGIIKTPVTRNDTSKLDSNWNLIGNPYPSAIDVDLFFEANVFQLNTNGPLEGLIYLWSQDTPPSQFYNGNSNLNFSPSDYAVINGMGSIAAQAGNGTKPIRSIPSCQGFFVNYSDDFPTQNSEVLFNNAMRLTENNYQFFRPTNTPKLWLNLTSNNAVFSQTLLAFSKDATDDFDGSYFDAETIISNDIPAKLYTTNKDLSTSYCIQAYALNGLNNLKSYPLGFYSAITVPTIFSIAIEEFQGVFFEENALILKDKLLNVYHDLKTSNYQFTSSTGTFNSRFEILFNAQTLSTDFNQYQDYLQLFQTGSHQLTCKLQTNTDTLSSIEIYDISGKKILEKTAINSTKIVLNLMALKTIPFLAIITLSSGKHITKKGILKTFNTN